MNKKSDAISKFLGKVLPFPDVIIFMIREYIDVKIGTSVLDCIKKIENGSSIVDVPRELVTRKLCIFAIQKSITDFRFIPEDLLSEELASIAMRYDGRVLGLLPVKLRTYKVCLMAIAENPKAIQYVPENSRLMYQIWISNEINKFFKWVRSFCQRT